MTKVVENFLRNNFVNAFIVSKQLNKRGHPQRKLLYLIHLIFSCDTAQLTEQNNSMLELAISVYLLLQPIGMQAKNV